MPNPMGSRRLNVYRDACQAPAQAAPLHARREHDWRMGMLLIAAIVCTPMLLAAIIRLFLP